MLARIIAIITGVSALLLVLLFLTTTPATSGPLGILGFFVFMYLTALGVLTFLFQMVSTLLFRLGARGQTKLQPKEVTVRTSYYYSSVIASVPVMFVAIQSVGEVGIYQVLLIFFFVIIAWIYVSNRTM